MFRRLEDIRETISELTEEQLISLGREEYDRCMQGQSNLIEEQKQSGLSWNDFADARSAAIKGVVAQLRGNDNDIPMTRIRAHQLAEENRVLIPKNSKAYQQLLKVCADAFIDAKRAELAVLEGYSVHSNPNPMFVNPATGQPHPYKTLGEQLAEPPEPTPSLTNLMEKFLANPNKHRTKKTKDSVRGYLDVVFQIIGNNTPVGEISEGTIEEVRDLIMRLPPNFKKLPNAERLWRKYSRLSKTVERQNAEKVERDYVVQSLGYDDAKQVPHSMDDFRNASSLEEKAMIAELIAADFAETMDEIAQHFHYKRNMFGRGATRTYSLIYAILALSQVFEAYNNRGRAAGVTLAAHGSGHEGDFLRFVLSFIEIADTRNQNHRLTDGLNERVRKIAQKRNIDPGLISLLDQEDIDASVMLTFMERVDALKA